MLTRLLLRGLPSEAVGPCLASGQMRALIRFRFAYIFAVHAPVLVPLLEVLSGRLDPALGMLSLGVASLTMVIAEVPAGLYADRRGPKAALRLGLTLLALVMLGFFVLGVLRATFPPTSPGLWPPGVAGVFALEIAIGVALSLISGADTVLFVETARSAGAELGIDALTRDGIEGLGHAIRLIGTAIAVAIGATLYHLFIVLELGPAWTIIAQSALFLGTLAATFVALAALRRIDAPARALDEGNAPRVRVGPRLLISELGRIRREHPALFARLWVFCLTLATAMFAVYLFQSPLSRMVETLLTESTAWLPLYTLAMMLGWWTSAWGARLFLRLELRSSAPRAGRAETAGGAAASATRWLLPGCLVLLAIYPAVRGSTGAFSAADPLGRLWLVGSTVAVFVCFNVARGFVQPFARTLLVAYARRREVGLPTSLISVFSASQRLAHFLLTLVFFLSVELSAQDGPGRAAPIALSLWWTILGIAALGALGLVPRRARRGGG